MIKFILTSYYGNIERAKALVHEMVRVGVPKSFIHVVVGGSKEDRVEIENEVSYSYVSHNSYEYSAFIEVAEKPLNASYIFVIHDTCKLGDDFFKKVMSYVPTPFEYIPSCLEKWFNMGIFKIESIRRHRDYFLGIKNCNKQHALLLEKVVPTLFKSPETMSLERLGVRDKQEVFYLPEFDIYKYQSHHRNSERLWDIVGAKQFSGKMTKDGKGFQNVFACLVHEKIESVVDTINNLSYFDPNSKIILYNGSHTDFRLLDSLDLKRYPNVYVHPNPKPQEYGRLHQFMVDCILFASDNFYFDTITNCDSDQLLLRKGYSELIEDNIDVNTGMFISPHSTYKFPLFEKDSDEYMEPFPVSTFNKEFRLWSPIINKYRVKNLDSQIWTFNPGTVITRKGANAIIDCCKDPLFQNAMYHSKIFATEEIFFNLMCMCHQLRLKTNPISFKYINYKREYNPEAMRLSSGDYWIHPVPRDFDHPLRAWVRTNNNFYL